MHIKKSAETKGLHYHFRDSFCDSFFCGRTEHGIRIHINDRQVGDCILLYQEDVCWRWLCEIDSDEILLPFGLFGDLGNADWYFYLGRTHDRQCDVICLRNTALEIPIEASSEFFDMRKLYGSAISCKEGILLPHYGPGKELSICSCRQEEDKYRYQIQNKILDVEQAEDSAGLILYTKCWKIQGDYIGVCSYSDTTIRGQEIEIEPYIMCDAHDNDVYMSFFIPKADMATEYDVAWRYHGHIYTAPLKSNENLPGAELIDFHITDCTRIELDIRLDKKRWGEFQSAKLIYSEEEWNRSLEQDVPGKNLEDGKDAAVFSLVIDTHLYFQKMGSWYLYIVAQKGANTARIPLVVNQTNFALAQMLDDCEVADYSDTTRKLRLGIKDRRWCAERKFGHNVLVRKNCLDTDLDESLAQFLARPDVSPKGEMYGQWEQRPDGRMGICLYQKMPELLEAALVMFHTQGMGVLCVQPLEIRDGRLEPFSVDIPSVDADGRFPKPVSSVWFRVALALRTVQGVYFTFLKNYGLRAETYRDGVLYDERSLYFPPIGEKKICGGSMSAVPYYAGNRLVSMKYVRPEQLYRSQFCCELLDVRIRQDVMTVRVRCRDCGGTYRGILMEYRKVKEDDAQTYLIPYESLEQEDGGTLLMVTRVDMKKYYMRMLYWDIRVAFESGSVLYNVACYSNNRRFLKKYDGIFVDRTYPNESSILFPYATVNNSVALMHRETVPQDHWWFRLKEKLAMALYRIFQRFWDKKNIYLVFEKFCSMAQDNGYYFFRYCMDADVEKEFQGHIYYVIDRRASDWENVAPYKKHVVRFLSLRHLIYLQACRLMISTDTKGHAYVWRSMGSVIKKLTYRKNLVFLQHGVIGFKKVHCEKGTNVGCECFITSSVFEQDIVCQNLGYTSSEVPVTGLARWDVLQNKSDKSGKILLMPTWRTWLDDAENEIFAQSDYCINYIQLLNHPMLEQILDAHDIILYFYLHPKFRRYITEFHIVSDHVRLIPFGEEPLNELLMSCDLLITDYSSVAWDFYYMKKPVLFYHFDTEEMEKSLGFYMDMESDLFGERAQTPEELIQFIEEYIETDWNLKPGYLKDREKYFAYIDHNNCERIYQVIKKY